MGRVRRRVSLRDKRQFQVVDAAVHNRIIGEEGDNAHLAAAARAEHRVNLTDLADHLGPDLCQSGIPGAAARVLVDLKAPLELALSLREERMLT